ncbi:MAG: hypothetical protein FJX57_14675, partial [Alphaproteobacteria bacterium]|nr:hypothetical protein [Alphaproteobacteria bacterium]
MLSSPAAGARRDGQLVITLASEVGFGETIEGLDRIVALRGGTLTRAVLDLPPPYRLVALREVEDAFAHACRIAADAGAGTLVWVRRADVAEFAVVLEPEEPLKMARRVFFAGMNAVGDAISALCQPEKSVSFDWPDAIRLDGGLVGGGRLGWPRKAAEDAPPAWLVFAATVRTMLVLDREPGLVPQATALAEEGAESADAAALIESAARHLMVALDAWNEKGFQPVGEQYLARLGERRDDERRGIAPDGDLVIRGGRGKDAHRALLPGLRAPTWFDPK